MEELERGQGSGAKQRVLGKERDGLMRPTGAKRNDEDDDENKMAAFCKYNSLLRWPISDRAKHTFPRQNILSHGKTYFSTAKSTFSRQNILFHGKTFYRFQSLSVYSFPPFEIRDLVIDLIQDGGRGDEYCISYTVPCC